MPDETVLWWEAGLRLRSVIEGSPKAMASISGRPFLELLLRQLRRHGFRHVILAAGYEGDVIRSHFGLEACGLCLACSLETVPLGTGGAPLNAAVVVESDCALVMNGDSYTDVGLKSVVAHYGELNAGASVVVVGADERRDCGSVKVDGGAR